MTAPRLTFRVVVGNCSDADILCRIWSCVAMTGHDILAFDFTTLLPFAAFVPDGLPFFKVKKKLDAAFFGVSFVLMVSKFGWISRASRLLLCPSFLSVGSMVVLPVFTRSFFVFMWHQPRSLFRRVVVRDGISADTLVPSRLYPIGSA